MREATLQSSLRHDNHTNILPPASRPVFKGLGAELQRMCEIRKVAAAAAVDVGNLPPIIMCERDSITSEEPTARCVHQASSPGGKKQNKNTSASQHLRPPAALGVNVAAGEEKEKKVSNGKQKRQ